MAQTNARELSEALGKPLATRLKAMGKGIKVGTVLGARVLVKTVEAWTEADEVEKKGLLYLPQAVKEANKPLPTSGVVLAVGEDVDPRYTMWRLRDVTTHLPLTGNYTEPHNDPPPNTEWVPPSLFDGAMVFFSKFSGVDLAVDNEQNLRILSVTEIFCTLVPIDEVVEITHESTT